MADWLLQNEPIIRLSASAGLLVLFALWEQAGPMRSRAAPLAVRRIRNLVIAVVNVGAVRVLFLLTTASSVIFAGFADYWGWGLLGAVDGPPLVEFAAGFLLLDLLIYGQHVAMHKVPLLWRLHRVHHMDIDLDVTSGLRFHPGEILLSMAIKFAAIALLGPSALTVLVFEVVLNATSMFNHSNIRLPGWLDRLLRFVLVTPGMHWVHHSIHRDETDSNYGFNLTWWDRLFRTYRTAPRDGYDGMTLGLAVFRSAETQGLLDVMANPFVKESR